MPEPRADLEPPAVDVDPGDPHASEPFWKKPEYAWPLALVAGFAGTWLGIRTTIPLLPVLFATAPFGVLYVVHVRDDQRLSAALLSSVWILGILGAVVGEALESGARPELFPGAAALIDSELAFLGGSPRAPLSTLPRNLTAFLLLGVLARPAWGLLAVVATGLLAGAIAGACSSWAVEAVAAGWTPSVAALAGMPPHLFLALMAAQVLMVALAEPGAGLEIRALSDLRRSLLFAAAGLGGIALGFQGQWVVAWRAWLTP